jgi:soluble lytic murein transglycosylase-like protein
MNPMWKSPIAARRPRNAAARRGRAREGASAHARWLIQALVLLLGGSATGASAGVFEIVEQDGTAVTIPAASIGAPCDPGCAPADRAPLQAIPERAITRMAAPGVPQAWSAALLAAASTARISPHLLAALVHQESGWRAGVRSGKGAIGLAQLMPATARQLGVDPLDPASNLLGGARYLRDMLDRFDGDIPLALAAYNAGPARVARGHAVPAISETKIYVNQVLDRLTAVRTAAVQGVVP